MTNYAELLETAADLLKSDRFGWIQRQLHEHDNGGDRGTPGRDHMPVTQVCGAGALSAARCTLDRVPVTVHSVRVRGLPYRLHDLLVAQLGMSLARWNDDPSRTKQDVIDLFEQVAKDLRNGDLS